LNPFQHAIALGNEKPIALKMTEHALWRALVNIATGQLAGGQLSIFVTSTELLLNDVGGVDTRPQWFIEGMTPMGQFVLCLQLDLIRTYCSFF